MSCTIASTRPASPLMLADQLLTVAQETDRAGYPKLAEQLLGIAFDVLEQRAPLN